MLILCFYIQKYMYNMVLFYGCGLLCYCLMCMQAVMCISLHYFLAVLLLLYIAETKYDLGNRLKNHVFMVSATSSTDWCRTLCVL